MTKKSASDEDAPEFSSPACSMREAGDAYMGYADRVELAALLDELLEAERQVANKLREILPKVRDDRLHAGLTGMLQSHEAGIALVNGFEATSHRPAS